MAMLAEARASAELCEFARRGSLEAIKLLVDVGVDAVIMNLPTSLQGYQPGHITALGEALKPLVAG